jgi:AGCS family alanine or glycine:cation symporter
VLCGVESGVDIAWGQSAGTEVIASAFGVVFGEKFGSLIVAVGISLFALSTILSWSLYGTRCFEFLTGGKGVGVFQTVFVFMVVVGATLKLDLVWNIADTLNGFMAIPNLIALIGLSGVVVKLTKDHFSSGELKK